MALLLVAFLGGAGLVGWLMSTDRLPWSAEQAATNSETPLVSYSKNAAPVVNSGAIAVPTVLTGDAARIEAMVVAMAARRAIESGTQLGPLEPRLNAAFGRVQPDALATLISGARVPLTSGMLLAELDEIGEPLKHKPGSAWEIARREMSNLFVLRQEDSAPTGPDAQLEHARQLLVSGDAAGAARTVEAMPGAANGSNWLNKARRYVAMRRALDALDAAAVAIPVMPPVAPAAPAVDSASETPASETPAAVAP
jgi:hypothetical protein